MILQTQTFKSGAWTTFDRELPSGLYVVKVYSSGGELLDKVRCDDYRMARQYLRAFKSVAKARS